MERIVNVGVGVGVGEKDKDPFEHLSISSKEKYDLNSLCLSPSASAKVVKEFLPWTLNSEETDLGLVTLTIPNAALFFSEITELFNLARRDFPDLDPSIVVVNPDSSEINFLWERENIPDCYKFRNQSRGS